jgi:hypothetical protein
MKGESTPLGIEFSTFHPTLTHLVIIEVVEHVHVVPVLRTIHRHDVFREVHDEEERGLVGGQAAVLEKALVLM